MPMFTLRSLLARPGRKTGSLHPLVGRPGWLGPGWEGGGGRLGGGVRAGETLRGCQAGVRRVVRWSCMASSSSSTGLGSLLLPGQGTSSLTEYRRLEVPERRRTERGVFVGGVQVTSEGLGVRGGRRRLELGSYCGCSSVMVPLRVAVPGGVEVGQR